MSQIKLIQRLRSLSSQLADAIENGDDQENIDALEDEIAEIENELEEEDQDDYDSHHNKQWS